jgi:hypothetical protein
MRQLAMVVVAAVVLANLVEGPVGAQDRVAEVLAAARAALGGDKLVAVKALSAEGPFRRSVGQRDMEGTLALLVMRPDKIRRSEDVGMGGMVNGPTVERISGFNGTEAWDDIQNRGGMGGGMQIRMQGGPGGPGGPGGGPGGALTPEQISEQRARRMRMELQRWTVALFADSTQPFTDAGVAESPDGKADVLETTDEAGRTVKLFIDQATHLPLMVQYQEVRPRVMIDGRPRRPRRSPGGAGGGGGGGARAQRPSEAELKQRQEEMQQRIEEMRKQGPPPPSQFAMHLGEYKKVDGVMLPHQIAISIDGQPNEEWTIEKYKVNPSVKPSEFEKPKD